MSFLLCARKIIVYIKPTEVKPKRLFLCWNINLSTLELITSPCIIWNCEFLCVCLLVSMLVILSLSSNKFLFIYPWFNPEIFRFVYFQSWCFIKKFNRWKSYSFVYLWIDWKWTKWWCMECFSVAVFSYFAMVRPFHNQTKNRHNTII